MWNLIDKISCILSCSKCIYTSDLDTVLIKRVFKNIWIEKGYFKLCTDFVFLGRTLLEMLQRLKLH